MDNRDEREEELEVLLKKWGFSEDIENMFAPNLKAVWSSIFSFPRKDWFWKKIWRGLRRDKKKPAQKIKEPDWTHNLNKALKNSGFKEYRAFAFRRYENPEIRSEDFLIAVLLRAEIPDGSGYYDSVVYRLDFAYLGEVLKDFSFSFRLKDRDGRIKNISKVARDNNGNDREKKEKSGRNLIGIALASHRLLADIKGEVLIAGAVRKVHQDH